MILLILTALSVFVTALGVIVYINRDRHILNKIFLIFIFLVDFWIISNLLSHIPFENIAYLGAQLGIIGPSWIPPALLSFSYIFANGVEKFRRNQKYIFLTFIPSLLLTLFTFAEYNVKNLEVTTVGNFFTPGILYYFLISYLVVSFILIFSYLIKAYNKSKGIARLQSVYIIYSFIFTLVFGIVFTAILPLFGIKKTTFVGPFSTVFLLSFTSYAILRYRLMDIRVIIRRSAVFTILVAIITSVYALSAYLITTIFQDIIGTSSVLLNGIMTAVLVAVGFEPLKKWLSNVTDKYLFKAEYDPQELLTSLGLDVISIANLTSILKTVSNKLQKAFKLDSISFYLHNREKERFELGYSIDNDQPAPKKLDAKELMKFHEYFEKLNEKIIK